MRLRAARRAEESSRSPADRVRNQINEPKSLFMSQNVPTKAGTGAFSCLPGSSTSLSFSEAQFTKNRSATGSTRETGGEGSVLTQELPSTPEQRSMRDSSQEQMPKPELLQEQSNAVLLLRASPNLQRGTSRPPSN